MDIINAKNDLYYFSDKTSKIDCISGAYNQPLGHSSDIEKSIITSSLAGIRNSYRLNSQSTFDLKDSLNKYLDENRFWHFLSTGSEAVERSIMIGIGKSKTIVMMENSFHGKGFLSAFAHYKPNWNQPLNIVKIPWMDFSKLPNEFDTLIFEPIQGQTGKKASDKELIQLRLECTKRNALLIADEILCGLWRTGINMPSKLANPDILIISKGLSGTIPLSAVGLCNESDVLVDWYTTHANNALANKIAIQTLPLLLEHSISVVKFKNLFSHYFPDAIINGSLIFIKKPKNPKKLSNILNKLVLGQTDNLFRLCLCYTMTDKNLSTLIEILKENEDD